MIRFRLGRVKSRRAFRRFARNTLSQAGGQVHGRRRDGRAGFRLAIIPERSAQIRFPVTRRLPGTGFFACRQHFNIGFNPGALDGTTGRRVIARCGQADGAIPRDGHHGLHTALAEGFHAHQHRAAMVLQGARHNFTGAGAATIDQHHNRLAQQRRMKHPLTTGIKVITIN